MSLRDGGMKSGGGNVDGKGGPKGDLPLNP